MPKTSLGSVVPLLALLVLLAGVLPAAAQPGGTTPPAITGPTVSYGPERGGINTLWNIETVDSVDTVGWDSSIAVDAAGHPHISYCRQEPYMGGTACSDLKYTWSDGTTWRTETVDTEGFTGKNSSLALDSAGWPHIAYTQQFCYTQCSTLALKYASYDGVSWQIETVDSGSTGAYPSLVLDNQNHPHISYRMGPGTPYGDGLKYTWYDGSTWHYEVVEEGLDRGDFTSLALDSTGRPHITYVDEHTYKVKYTWYDGAAWQIEVIETFPGGVNMAGTALVLDSSNRPRVAYLNNNSAHLTYAWRDEADWHPEFVDYVQSTIMPRSLALDSLGRPRLVYYDGSPDRDLHYAWHDGDSWRIETVDSAGDVGQFAALALDALDQVHISYSDDTNGDLKYAIAPCVPVQALDVGGPARWATGVTAAYTVSYAPTSTTYPQLSWDNGTLGPSAVYSWTVPGLYSVTVTATNPCSEVSRTRRVAVVCQPPEQVTAAGSPTLFANQGETYQAVAQPITASLPITYTWDDGVVGPTHAYTWTVPGVYTRTLTATNECGQQVGSFSVTVNCLPVQESDFSWNPVTPTMGQPVTFTATVLSVAERWLTETVDSTGDVGYWNSLALDAADRPHISYRDLTDLRLKYASRVGSSWQVETIPNMIGIRTSLKLDQNGFPHIGYQDTNVIYAHYDGTRWQTETVGSGLTDGVSLVLDSQSRPHLSYDSESLYYAWYDGFVWQDEVVDNNVTIEDSLALDAAGNPHIGYSHWYSGGDMCYAWYDGSQWHLETVDNDGHTGLRNSLALDSAGHPHLSYVRDYPDSLLKYASYDGANWQIETVAAIEGAWDTSLGVDASGQPHIAYCESPGGKLNYASRDGTTWYTQTVDSGLGRENLFASLALDSHGWPRISYYDSTHGDLRYAWREYVPPTEPISYTWDLGDGTVAQGPAVQHAYDRPGVYTVVLTATNCQGEGSAVATHAVMVSGTLPCDPVQGADFSWTPLTPTAGLPVTLTASAGGTLPITFTWDLGDGAVSTGTSLTHVYTVPGDYTVTLTAANCATATVTSIHHLAVTAPPVLCEAVHEPLFTWNPLTPTSGQPVTLTALASGTLPITFTWDLGDGMAGMGLSLTHVYTIPGTYTVTLTAANCATATASVVGTLTVTAPPTDCVPVHDLFFTWTPFTPTVGQMVTLTAEASGTRPISFSWELGDGTTGQGQVIDHTFCAFGSYTVTVMTVNSCGAGTLRRPLSVAALTWVTYLPLILRR